MLVNLLGSVALLLWGMRMVEVGVNQAFGADLRRMIGRSTRNPLLALLVGLGVTGLLQSSTATALMTVSFVRHGLVATAPALAVVESPTRMSLPVALVRMMPVPAAFRLAMTPVLDDFSLMAETALDRPSAPVVAEMAKETVSSVELSERRTSE